MAEQAEKKNTYISLHKNFVRTDIEYTDPKTGEKKTFNSVTLPQGTIIDGKDVGGYQFSPLYVNESKYRGENWRDIPLLTEREVWLQKSVLDPEGNPVIGEDGKRLKETVRVMSQQIKEALAESRRAYAEAHKDSLAERAKDVTEASRAMEAEQRPAPDAQAR